MIRIKNIKELSEFRDKLVKERDPKRPCITICTGTGCHAYGCEKVAKAFITETDKRRLKDKVDIRTTECHGFCERGPIVLIHPQGIFYQRSRSKMSRGSCRILL
jgi:NADH-quinone oxidoreductase subunit F